MRTTNHENLNEKDVALFKTYKQRSFQGHKKQPAAICWNHEGNLFVTAENIVKIWAFDEQYGLEFLNEIKGHDSPVTEASFLNSNILLTMSRDTLKLWDIRGSNLKAIRTQKKPKSDLLNVVWKHDLDNPQFTVLFKDGQISSYDLRSNSLAQPLNTTKPTLEINQIIWDRTDSILFASYLEGGSGEIVLYDSNLQQIPDLAFQLHNGKINAMEVSASNQYLVTCSEDSSLQIHTLPEIICTHAYSHTDTPYKKISISPNAEYIAVSCEEPYIHFYNVQKGGHAYKLPVSSNQEALAWHPRKQILAFIDQDQKRNSKSTNQKGQDAYIRLFSPN